MINLKNWSLMLFITFFEQNKDISQIFAFFLLYVLKLIDTFLFFLRAAKEEMLALSQMAEQLNSKFGSSQQHQQNSSSDSSQVNGTHSLSSSHQHSNESVDLDNLFAFLSEVQPGSNGNSNAVIDEIGQQMNNLVEDLDVELESVIQQEIEGLAMERPCKPTKKGYLFLIIIVFGNTNKIIIYFLL